MDLRILAMLALVCSQMFKGFFSLCFDLDQPRLGSSWIVGQVDTKRNVGSDRSRLADRLGVVGSEEYERPVVQNHFDFVDVTNSVSLHDVALSVDLA